MSASSEHAVKRDHAVVILEEDLHENVVQLQFEPGTVIAAQPITVVRPGGVAVPVSVSRSRRRDPEEMSKRPTWLPDDWTFKLATRKTGATAGLIDPYYWDPSGEKFRSKREVLYFLKTGKRIEKKTKPQATTKASGRPSRKKKRNSSAQSTKPEA